MAMAAAAMAQRATFFPVGIAQPPAPPIRKTSIVMREEPSSTVTISNRYRLHSRAQSDVLTRFNDCKHQLHRRNSHILEDDDNDGDGHEEAAEAEPVHLPPSRYGYQRHKSIPVTIKGTNVATSNYF